MLTKQAYTYRRRWEFQSLPVIQNEKRYDLFVSCSDNGITIQIMCYQLLTELVMFIALLFIAIIPIERNMLMLKIFGILANFLFFVIQPLFYLNGDVNFRRRVLHHGLLKAMKKELFETT